MQIRKTASQWREIDVDVTCVDKIRVDNLGNVYAYASMGEGLRTNWAWRRVTNPVTIKTALSWGMGDHDVLMSWK